MENCKIARGIAFIFDLDGVVIDSMPTHTEAWRVYLNRYKLEADDLATRMHGRRNDDIVRAFFGADLDAKEVHGHGAAKEALFRELMAPSLKKHLVPGVTSFLDRCADTPTGLASNAEPANIEFVLAGAGIAEHFDVVVDGHQVDRPKPFPDIYLRAAELMGILPENCVVFEDSPAGIEAGRMAGARVVGVQTHTDELPTVDFLIRNFEDPALRPWLESLKAR